MLVRLVLMCFFWLVLCCMLVCMCWLEVDSGLLLMLLVLVVLMLWLVLFCVVCNWWCLVGFSLSFFMFLVCSLLILVLLCLSRLVLCEVILLVCRLCLMCCCWLMLCCMLVCGVMGVVGMGVWVRVVLVSRVRVVEVMRVIFICGFFLVVSDGWFGFLMWFWEGCDDVVEVCLVRGCNIG